MLTEEFWHAYQVIGQFLFSPTLQNGDWNPVSSIVYMIGVLSVILYFLERGMGK